MNSFSSSSLLTVTIFLSLALVHSEYIELENIAKVIPGPMTYKETAGLVFGAQQCGGEVRFIQVRLDGCNTTDSPCQYPADGKKRSAYLTYIPRQDVKQLGLRLIYSINGNEPEVVFDQPLKNSAVQGGVLQTVVVSGQIPEENKGKKLTSTFILFRVIDSVIETCAKADYFLV